MPISKDKVSDCIEAIEDYIDYWRDCIQQVNEDYPQFERSTKANRQIGRIEKLIGANNVNEDDDAYHANPTEEIDFDTKFNTRAWEGTLVGNNRKKGMFVIMEKLQQAKSENDLNGVYKVLRLYNMISDELPVLDYLIIMMTWLRRIEDESTMYLLSDAQLDNLIQGVTEKLEKIMMQRSFTDARLLQLCESWRQNLGADNIGDYGLKSNIEKFKLTHEKLIKSENKMEEFASTTLLNKVRIKQRGLMELAKNLGIDENTILCEQKKLETSKNYTVTPTKDEVTQANTSGIGDMLLTITPPGLFSDAKQRKELRQDPELKSQIVEGLATLAQDLGSLRGDIVSLLEQKNEAYKRVREEHYRRSHSIIMNYESGLGSSESWNEKIMRQIDSANYWSKMAEKERELMYKGETSLFALVAENIIPKIIPSFVNGHYDPEDSSAIRKIDDEVKDRRKASIWRKELMSLHAKNAGTQNRAAMMINIALISCTAYILSITALTFAAIKFTIPAVCKAIMLTNPIGQYVALGVGGGCALLTLGSFILSNRLKNSHKSFLDNKNIPFLSSPFVQSRWRWLTRDFWVKKPCVVEETPAKPVRSEKMSFLTRCRRCFTRPTVTEELDVSQRNSQTIR